MRRALYSLLLYLLLPLVVMRFLWRGWRDAAQRGSLAERLAFAPAPRADSPLWLHAASMGELRALAALLHARGQSSPVLVTSITPTGVANARRLFGAAGHEVCAAPWDLPGATRRFLAAVRPRALVLVEVELWPNLIAAAAARRVPVALLSARLSERSLQRYLRFAPGLMRQTVRALAVIGAQTEADRQRFIRLGADPARVQVMGNLKFDLPPDPSLPQQGAELRARWAAARPLWVAGSTHAGEEEVLLAAQARLVAQARAQDRPSPVLALAPRRPERFEAVARWLQQQGLPHARASAGGLPATGADVVLVDEMGVLPRWYAAADFAFVGGSLVPVGGHNLLEPAALGRPVLCGPHTFHAPEVTRLLVEAGGARVVRDVEEVAAALAAWLSDPAAAAADGAKAAAAVRASQGAARRAVELLSSLPAPPSATG
ncbi:MAG: 3-deoxy-D-manno-octulosonic acid transferase [Pseudomonadota bacterium]|jgi:3-deoxy-D-manno-octulosonic-acid transferase